MIDIILIALLWLLAWALPYPTLSGDFLAIYLPAFLMALIVKGMYEFLRKT